MMGKECGLLKFITCGSVDDGKSTLIGHILYDSKLLYADQEKALILDSKVGSRAGAIDYSLLLDGLMAEREQGITIDVAYRYFTTDKRSFIVADTPGHEEYTRNMAVGASFADLAVILVDAAQGVLAQTRRHARICAMMGIRYFVFAVNKMDLAGYSQKRFTEIKEQIDILISELSLPDVKVIPVSATEGDNVTKKSENMSWYQGEALLPYLERVEVAAAQDAEGFGENVFYMPIQRVCRPDHTFRGFQGQIEAGEIHVGDTLAVLPGSEKAGVMSLFVGNRKEQSACAGQPVTIQLDREVDVSRGSVLAKDVELPLSRLFTAKLLWMDDQELSGGKEYLMKLGTRQIPAVVKKIWYKIDVNTGESIAADRLAKNEIAVCEIALQERIVLDAFTKHGTLGELILMDRVTNMTSACGVVESVSTDENTDPQCMFAYGSLKARADLFDEYFYQIGRREVTRTAPDAKSYTVGDDISVEGVSYHYPDSFDILFLGDGAAAIVRDRKIASILPIESYRYAALPVVDGCGFGLSIAEPKEADALIAALKKDPGSQFLNQWAHFGTYRKIVFED